MLARLAEQVRPDHQRRLAQRPGLDALEPQQRDVLRGDAEAVDPVERRIGGAGLQIGRHESATRAVARVRAGDVAGAGHRGDALGDRLHRSFGPVDAEVEHRLISHGRGDPRIIRSR
jgi:hypothetical protein